MSTKLPLVALASISVAAIAMPAVAADVTPQRLLDAANDSPNWLMVHHDYNNSRHSPLRQVNRDNIGGFGLPQRASNSLTRSMTS